MALGIPLILFLSIKYLHSLFFTNLRPLKRKNTYMISKFA